ncbi:hypothetical protein CCM_02440 [Cordyceps militaris CM01]|uniref:Uncharacterized protein n=1 Tax=Cordyceps militaris (strain CM01) TaxID=983644 RepID=G3J9P3_CORMM|nr:uncharacterized protein CCM_02440 [Cordyceps militaris CM01]EGX94169.1 hypothetical protein CCM_02440 [Cordyceps militaris CM01]
MCPSGRFGEDVSGAKDVRNMAHLFTPDASGEMPLQTRGCESLCELESGINRACRHGAGENKKDTHL